MFHGHSRNHSGTATTTFTAVRQTEKVKKKRAVLP